MWGGAALGGVWVAVEVGWVGGRMRRGKGGVRKNKGKTGGIDGDRESGG